MSRPKTWIESPGTVLVIHNYYQLRGGEDVGYETETSAMRSLGWNVHTLDVTNKDLDKVSPIKMSLNTLWNKEAAERVRQKIKEIGADVVHVNNFFPSLSPSIHWAAKKSGAAVVQTLHNFRLGCLNGAFYRDGATCLDCLGKAPIPGIIHKCYRDSLPASATVFGMLEIHRALGTWDKAVDAFIALTDTSRELLIRVGLPASRLHTKPGMLYPDYGVGTGDGGFCLFVGRFTVEKGVATLLQAWASDSELPDLVLVGSGPLEDKVREAAGTDSRIRLMGHMPKAEVIELMKHASMLVFPSQWMENCPAVLSESMSVGTPVVASSLGSTHDILSTGEHAHFFDAGDPKALAEAVSVAISSGQMAEIARISARRRFEAQFAPASNLAKLATIYDAALDASGRR